MAWGGSSNAWASQVEEEEKEGPAPVSSVLGAKADDEELFPSLGAAAAKPQKKKKEKARPMNLAEFNTGKFMPRARAPQNDDDILLNLPKGPAARDPDEEDMAPGLGGAFRDYGGDRGGPRGGGQDFQGGSEDRRDGGGRYDGRGRHDEREDRDFDRDAPSRADEDADWGASRKFQPSGRDGGGGREGGRGGFDDRDERGPPREFDDGPSRADESRNWGGDKKFVPSERDDRDRGREDDRGPPRTDVDAVHDWKKEKKFVPSTPEPARDAPPRSGADTEDRWSRRGPPAYDGPPPRADGPDNVDRWGRRDGPPPASGPGGERPRLNLAPPSGERTKLNLKPRSDDAPAGGGGGGKANPFGGARPREEALAEKGRDWKREEFELARKGVDRADTDEEKRMKADIAGLQARVLAGEADELCDDDTNAKPEEDEDAEYPQAPVKDVLAKKEAALLHLSASLDDKVRFAQKAPGPRGGAEEKEGEGKGDKERVWGRKEEATPKPADSGRWERGGPPTGAARGGGRGEEKEGGRAGGRGGRGGGGAPKIPIRD